MTAIIAATANGKKVLTMRPIDADNIAQVAEHAYNEWNLAMAAADGRREINHVYKMQELCKAVNAVANAAPTITLDDLRPSGRWIDAKAQHPPLDKMVLVIVNGKPKNNITLDQAYELAEWEPEGWCLEMWPEWMEAEVSHWMPLPEPPKED